MKFITLFEDLSTQDIAAVGGKNASLGEMIQNLSAQGIPVPRGFVITANAYKDHLIHNNLTESLKQQIATIDKNRLETLHKAAACIRGLIASAPLHETLIAEVRQAYQNLEQEYGVLCPVAVRSSATAEDLPNASFAGQQETYLNVRGIDSLLERIPHSFASLFTDRAISYRIDQGFNQLDVALSIGVQHMIDASEGSAGIMFTLDTESGFPDVVLITASYGLGEPIVQGSVNPDEFYVHKPTLKQGFAPLLKKQRGSKMIKMAYNSAGEGGTCILDVPRQLRETYALTNEECLTLARFAVIIEDHYSAKAGKWTPMDIEWVKDGQGQLFIVQARPETIHSNSKEVAVIQYQLDRHEKEHASLLIQGRSVGTAIVSGIARVVKSVTDIGLIKAGDILVTEMTNPDWEPIMKKAAGIVTNSGGRTCHAAIVSRELGIPAIIGTERGTEVITDGTIITLDCSSGDEGTVYQGSLSFSTTTIAINNGLHNRPYKTMLNIGHPDEAFRLAQLPSDGVGLARIEFIINAAIKIHPMALVSPENVTDPAVVATISSLTAGYKNRTEYFIDILAEQAGTIAAAFYPRPVIIRLSDFKTNEYRQLIAGEIFESEEENPMLGLRGASRYSHPRYAGAFALECAAIKKIRETMGLTNVIVMLPFVRTVDEAKKVIDILKRNGLKGGVNGLELYMMCEVPSNVILIEKFAELFDGFSIGSNDLTQLVLGVDRDSAELASLFDERNEAVLFMIEQAVTRARKAGKAIGICGQAPSDYPELKEKLMEWGITSISLAPDAYLQQCAQ